MSTEQDNCCMNTDQLEIIFQKRPVLIYKAKNKIVNNHVFVWFDHLLRPSVEFMDYSRVFRSRE